MPTRIAIQRTLCRLRYAGSAPIDGTNTSSTGTTITDTTGHLNYSSGDVNAFDRKFVYVVQAADAGSRGQGRVTEGGWTVTGSLTVDPSIDSLASGDLYIISDDPPDDLQNAINAILRNQYPPTFFPLSLHIMGNDANDMEPSTVATDYSATNGTRAIESTIVHGGAQSLKLTATATGGYANTGTIGMPESKSLYAAVMCYVTSGDSATFRVVDVTDSNATIEDAITDEPSWTELMFLFNSPADSEQIDFRFISDASGDIAYWDDFQIWHSGTGVYPLPSWITRPEQVIGVRGFPQGTTGPSSDNDFRANERRSVPLAWDFERADKRAGSELHIVVEGTSYRPFIYALRSLPELTSDTGSTVADLDDVVFWASEYLDAETAQEKSQVLKRLRSLYFVRPTTQLPRRVGV